MDWKRIGSCSYTFENGRTTKRWPCHARIGQWCLTFPAYFGSNQKGPNLDSEWFSVTHQPTGYRGGDVRCDDPRAMDKLSKYDSMFGRSVTVAGIMRKWRKLSPYNKRWIAKQVSWRLPSEKVKASKRKKRQ